METIIMSEKGVTITCCGAKFETVADALEHYDLNPHGLDRSEPVGLQSDSESGATYTESGPGDGLSTAESIKSQQDANIIVPCCEAKFATIAAAIDHIESNPHDLLFKTIAVAVVRLSAAKEWFAHLTQDERLELYKFLHDAYGCRVY